MFKKITIENCHKLAKLRNGKCLSKKYINAHTKMLWECEFGHQWKTKYNKIQQKKWCPECANNIKKTIEDCHKLAKQNNGKCLSEKYKNNHTKLIWQCAKNHVFSMTRGHVISNHWCSFCAIQKCANKQRGNIKNCHKLAKQNNGKCLSKKYKNVNTKYLWQCNKKHKWKATYHSIQQGKWCSICAKIKRKNTMLKRYGVENAMHNINIALRCSRSSKYSYILFHWKTKEELVCVGSYEKKVVEYLNKNKIEYLWQPKIFKTSILTSKKCQSTYRPDLYLVDKDIWIEIKGWINRNKITKQKWIWFHKTYPNSELWDKKKLKEMEIL